jgi:hypothetical protein
MTADDLDPTHGLENLIDNFKWTNQFGESVKLTNFVRKDPPPDLMRASSSRTNILHK